MAQKFTVDPRLIQGAVIQSDHDDSDTESEDELTPMDKKAKERAALLDRLSREYEQSVKDAADNGECTMCSS
jgi:hypothetical protein